MSKLKTIQHKLLWVRLMLKEVKALFSSPVFICEIKEDTEALKKESTFLQNVTQSSGRKNEDLKVLKKYPRIKKLLLNEFKENAKRVLNYTNDFDISTSWMTATQRGDVSQSHCHKNSFYSGVYYYDEYEMECGGELEITSPLYNYFDFSVIPREWNDLTGRSAKIAPNKKLLILFPSYLFHQIKMHQGNSIRRSLAFNIVPVGEYGSADSSYNTSWFK